MLTVYILLYFLLGSAFVATKSGILRFPAIAAIIVILQWYQYPTMAIIQLVVFAFLTLVKFFAEMD